MFTRLTATVTMSAPDAACACAITACDGYLPLPTINRDLNVRPAMTKRCSQSCRLPAADEVHDLDAIALLDQRLRESGRLRMTRLCSTATRRGSIASLTSRSATDSGSSRS